jgi:hypothetical protein
MPIPASNSSLQHVIFISKTKCQHCQFLNIMDKETAYIKERFPSIFIIMSDS